MKTKNFVAILMASIIAMALITPMAMGGDVSAEVPNDAPFVCCQWEDPAIVEPNPNGLSTVTIHACVCDPNCEEDIKSVVAYGPHGEIIPLSKIDTCPDPDCTCVPTGGELDCVEYTGTFDMESCDASGIYQVPVIVTDKGGKDHMLVSEFEYISIMVIEAPDVVAFGEMELCVPKNVTIQIHNKGNDKATITVTADDMTCPLDHNGIISATNMDVDGNWDLSGPGKTIEGVFACCKARDVNISLHVPYGTRPGTYSGPITFTPTKAGECFQRADLGIIESETAVGLFGWSAQIVTKDTGGNYGGIGKYGARVAWGLGDDPLDDPCASVEFRECGGKKLQWVTVKHLDGLADDSFDVFVNNDPVPIGSYPWSGNTAEFWVITEFPVTEDYDCPVTVTICATGQPWNVGRWGQLAIDWIDIHCCDIGP
jgi:hypothetical protein